MKLPKQRSQSISIHLLGAGASGTIVRGIRYDPQGTNSSSVAGPGMDERLPLPEYYCSTTWAPVKISLHHPERALLLLLPGLSIPPSVTLTEEYESLKGSTAVVGGLEDRPNQAN